jgi:RAB protein geranylgeranyltransferase component A
MNVAILTISSLSLVCSLGTLVIMAKTAHELKTAKDQMQSDVEDVKLKVNRTLRRSQSILRDLEI